MSRFLFHYLLYSKRPLAQKCLYIPLTLCLLALVLYQFKSPEWAEVTGILISVVAYPWLLMGILVLMFNSVQQAHDEDPALPAQLAGTQLLCLLPIGVVLAYFFSLPTKDVEMRSVAFAAPLALFVGMGVLVCVAGLLSSWFNSGRTEERPLESDREYDTGPWE